MSKFLFITTYLLLFLTCMTVSTIVPPISISDLNSNRKPSQPVADEWLAPSTPDSILPASNMFNGMLSLYETSDINLEVIQDDYNYARYPTRRRLPPNSTVEFTQVDGRIVPLQRGLVRTNDIVWNLIWSIGLVWDEHDNVDNGWSRASVPFALSERNANCIQNGVMLFAYKTNGEITKVRFQITQETCKYYRVNYWGQLRAGYSIVSDTDARYIQARAQFRDEQEHRFPSVPFEQLSRDYPGVDPSVFGAKLTQEYVSGLGLVVNGINYVKPCKTRTGNYAGHCSEFVFPSYSTCKAILAGLAMMRLAELYGSGVYDELVRTYLPSDTQAARGNWDEVTFSHALDMSTGNYFSSEYQVDEDYYMGDFFVFDVYEDKVKAAFDYQYRQPPGRKHIYHTTDTFIVTLAMQKYLEVNVGKDADIWEMIVDDILKPLHVQSGAWTTLRTYGDVAQPYGGYGLFFTQDDVAKITSFVLIANGNIDGKQIIQSNALDAAMQRNPDNRGLNVDKPGSTVYFNNGFWAQQYSGAEVGCPEQDLYYQPYFSGFGGIRMVLMPNDVIYYYFSDLGEFEMNDEIREAGKIASICSKGSQNATIVS